MKIIGSYVSPYVRKVLACLALKGLDYEIDPITPFFGDDEFERLSPLRRIPVLVDGDLTLCDSTVICAWLDEAYPEPSAAPRRRRPTAPARAGSRNMPTRGSATSSSGACSTRRSSTRSSGASRATRRGSRRRWPRTLPRELDYLEGAAARRRLAVRRRSASPTSPSPASSATAPMPASRSTRRAGRAPPPSSSARSPIPASPTCSRSSRPSSAPARPAAARPCSPPARRSPPRRWRRASRGGA